MVRINSIERLKKLLDKYSLRYKDSFCTEDVYYTKDGMICIQGENSRTHFTEKEFIENFMATGRWSLYVEKK